MTYDALELSDQDGQPVRLYEFRRGQAVYRYTSADVDVSWNSQLWETRSGGVSDTGIRQSGPAEEDQLVIQCSNENEIVTMFRGTAPSDRVSLTVRRLHLDDPDLQASVVWVGLVGSARQPREGFAELVCESVLNGFQNAGLRLAYTRGCPHMLYDGECRVLKADFAVAATVTVASGTTIEVSGIDAFEDGWFSAGFVEWPIDMLGTMERRAIDVHTGNQLTLLNNSSGLTVSLDITLYPGCFRDTPTCKNKFNNLTNYGGFPHLPGIDPFQLGALFGQDSGDTASDGSLKDPTKGTGGSGGAPLDGTGTGTGVVIDTNTKDPNGDTSGG